jgi:hypothetical protein
MRMKILDVKMEEHLLEQTDIWDKNYSLLSTVDFSWCFKYIKWASII